jgi:hypothetical protein
MLPVDAAQRCGWENGKRRERRKRTRILKKIFLKENTTAPPFPIRGYRALLPGTGH